MDLRLSWDLFIIVFFGIIVAYSFIIGRNSVLKVILATYVGALCADAVGNLFSVTLGLSANFMKLLRLFYIGDNEQAVVLIKVVTFIAIIVLFSVRGAYHVEVENKGGPIVRLVMNLIFGFLNACLIVSIAMIYISGASFIIGSETAMSPAFQDIYNQSNLARILVDHYSVWFLLPALSFLGVSLLSSKSEN